jgi:hypothetical protein
MPDEILEMPQPATKSKGSSHEPGQSKATRGRGKRNRPPGDRQAFVCSPEYEQLNQLLMRTIQRKGLSVRNGRESS